ncbi:hypothetical protein [Alkalihalobacillus pseudalcaliphilus]|uniref:hypothetical protein n=1 Tax=Alkalihalobacillus pseudalcaliphilus TaxID=79884 RepID=UPI00064DAF2C|nr:hypothetical protein [Alkalihalobacillus pseudalcaliphilus]KMK75777.1 hypothetical protein AB990_10945 [Alkalihalobacillus pseudalcaliphilus]
MSQDFGLSIKKIWEDDFLYELKGNFKNQLIQVEVHFYSDDQSIKELIEGLTNFIEINGKEKSIWGSDDQVVKMVFLRQNQAGRIIVELELQNQLEGPEQVNAAFSIQTEFLDLERLVNKLKLFLEKNNTEFRAFPFQRDE